MYSSPHNELLKAHYKTFIFAPLSAVAEPLDVDDEPGLPELPSNYDNEAVRIWAGDTNQYPPAECSTIKSGTGCQIAKMSKFLSRTCRSDGFERTASEYRGLERGEAGVGDGGQGMGGVEGQVVRIEAEVDVDGNIKSGKLQGFFFIHSLPSTNESLIY